jgi:nucleoid-associated protein YgaU
VGKLTETTRELAQLRANYAKLQIERSQVAAATSDTAALQSRLGVAEEKLAASLHNYTDLQNEIGRLKSEVQQARTENVALTEQVRTVTAQNVQAQAALAQLNTELLAQKDARVRAEQDAETLRTQVAAAPNASTLAQQRTGAAAEARTLAAEQANEIISLKQDLDGLRAKLGALEGERAQLKQQLAAAPAADLANVEARLTTALRDNSDLRSAKADLETELARLKTMPAATEAQNLREQLQAAKAAASALTEENTRLRTRLTTNRVTPADQVTRINLDAPVPAPSRPTERATTAAAETVAPAEPAERPVAPSSGTITRSNGSGVSATLVASVPGGSRSAASRVEAAGAAAAQGRVHVVAGGDTLSKISLQYYGTAGRWADILAANRDILGEGNNLVIGRTLRIP